MTRVSRLRGEHLHGGPARAASSDVCECGGRTPEGESFFIAPPAGAVQAGGRFTASLALHPPVRARQGGLELPMQGLAGAVSERGAFLWLNKVLLEAKEQRRLALAVGKCAVMRVTHTNGRTAC